MLPEQPVINKFSIMIPPSRWHSRKQCLCKGLRPFGSSLPPRVWSQLFSAWDKGRHSSCSQPSETRHRLSWFWTRPFLPSSPLPELEQLVLTAFFILMPGTGASGGMRSLGFEPNPSKCSFWFARQQLHSSAQPGVPHGTAEGSGHRADPQQGPAAVTTVLTSWSLFRARLKEGYFSSITWFLHWGLEKKRKRELRHRISL